MMSRIDLPAPMALALDQARLCVDRGEVPVGAVIMRGDQVIAAAGNAIEQAHDPAGHAEIRAIRSACAALGSSRLAGCDLWVTLEPCAMCAAAISHARIDRLYYGAPDPKGGAVAHGPRWFGQPTCHHRPDVYEGFGADDAARLLRDFFAARR